MNWGSVRDNRGILYVANLSGILEYDGVSWRQIETPVGSWTLSPKQYSNNDGQT